ncbi:MAG: alanine--tRNA ligase [Patescibacteria group bacterium]
MSSQEIREKFLAFFKSKGHAVVPSSSLIPDDPSVLLTTAGMQQFKKYFTGELDAEHDFGAQSTTSIQKSFRTSDIDEVGDESHLTFFEMLGNFSFGGYFKKEAIQYAHEFITDVMRLKIDYVSVFAGEDNVPADMESEKIWKSLDSNIVVKKMGRADNFWGPTGSEGPCGPTTEIYVKNSAGKSVEIWNVVFNQYYQDASGKLTDLKTPGIDTGMGLERLAMVSQNVSTIFETDLFQSIFNSLPHDIDERIGRIFADHIRGISFLISDGVRPSNKEAGYVLRRLMRRLMVYGLGGGLEPRFDIVVKEYQSTYRNLVLNTIHDVYQEEREKFSKTLAVGLKELEKISSVNAANAFKIYETFGLPYEIIKEVGGVKASELTREAFDEEFKRHQEISRAGQEKKFGGHGLILNTGELKAKDEDELKKVTRLHTATHLLQAALRKVLGSEVSQKGSDITVERARFDFSFPRKLTPEEVKNVESLVNGVIQEDVPMQYKEMSKEEAEKTGALYFFKEKYPEKVKVYFAGKSLETAFSKEFCGGPHVTHTGEIGTFKIAKEEAVGSGVRRIRGIVMP